jgi:DNA-binding beta-propeller fold protein YncE
MAADTDSNVLIGDAESGSIQKFSINGEPRLFFQDGRFNVHPTDVAVNAGGGIYVVDEKRGNILIFSPEGDHFSEVQTGVPPAARSSIRIALDSFGTLYVAARQPFGIRKLNSSSKLEEIGSGGSTISTQLENPTSLAVGPNGLVYVSEAELPEIKVFSSAGGLQRTLSVPSNVVGTKFSGIATSGKFLFAVDAKYPAVHVWTLDGAYRLREDLSSWISGGVESQRKIACTPSGELLILDPLSWRVLRFRLHL